jgi:hypothetical protein
MRSRSLEEEYTGGPDAESIQSALEDADSYMGASAEMNPILWYLGLR